MEFVDYISNPKVGGVCGLIGIVVAVISIVIAISQSRAAKRYAKEARNHAKLVADTAFHQSILILEMSRLREEPDIDAIRDAAKNLDIAICSMRKDACDREPKETAGAGADSTDKNEEFSDGKDN